MISDAPVSEKKRILPTCDQEAPFAIERLFFSRTDAKGIIVSGNTVFQHISQYPWDELIDRPHSLVRHPDMPRAVFWLLWETIRQGRPIGAYVKNRAKDGRYYWVFAIVTPTPSGYLSVRLKPSVLVGTIEQEYRALVQEAATSKLSPQDSAGLLLERLAELGYPDYESFMAATLSIEVKARNAALGRAPDRNVECFDRLVDAAKAVVGQAETIYRAYELGKHTPLNLRIQAAQLGDRGATIDAISSNYGLIANEIKEKICDFRESARSVLATINSGLFMTCTSIIQQEVVDLFRTERADSDAVGAMQTRFEDNSRLLLDQLQNYRDEVYKSLGEIAETTRRFRQDCADMKRLATSLEVVRLMGKMESSRLTGLNEGLDKLFADLGTSQNAISDGLKVIAQMNREIEFDLRTTIDLTAAA